MSSSKLLSYINGLDIEEEIRFRTREELAQTTLQMQLALEDVSSLKETVAKLEEEKGALISRVKRLEKARKKGSFASRLGRGMKRRIKRAVKNVSKLGTRQEAASDLQSEEVPSLPDHSQKENRPEELLVSSIDCAGEEKASVSDVSGLLNGLLAAESFLFESESRACKERALDLIKEQTRRIDSLLLHCNEVEKEEAISEIFSYTGLFLNKGNYSKRPAIAFCHNFSPTVNPSAFVASKRLRQIDETTGVYHRWTVCSKDMGDIRAVDEEWDRWFAQFSYSDRMTVSGRTCDLPECQIYYALESYQFAKNIDAEVIYSRSMFLGSHLAAYLYKRDHPEVIWYAEFSDPVAVGVQGEWRDTSTNLGNERTDAYDDFYESCELIPYEFADYVIYTNEVQRDFMLGYCRDGKLKQRALKHSLVWRHPEVDPRYAGLIPSGYRVDGSKINIGYFGSFYVTRKVNDLLTISERDDVVVHLFVPWPKSLRHVASESVVVNEVRPYLEFLDIASKMDYVFLSDMQSIDGCTPWLPSKLSDYLSVDTPIIAKCNEGSPLSKIDKPGLIKIYQVDESFMSSLKKK